MKEESLVFIVSQPRSGSTYLQNILSNNAEVNTASEHWTLLNFTSLIKPELLQAQYDLPLATDAFRDYIAKYPEINYKEKLKQFILDLYQHQKEGHQLVLDKTPRYWELLNEIVELFPGAKIIILKRDPVKVVRSIIKTWRIDSLKKLTNYRRDLFLAPVRMNSFEAKQKHNTNLMVVKYEELLGDPTREVKKITDWLGITFSESMLSTDRNEKIRGKYGDPFQNPEQQVLYSKEKAASYVMNEELENFIKEYEIFMRENHDDDKFDLDLSIDTAPAINRFLKMEGFTNPVKDQKDLLNELQTKNRLLKKELNSIKNSRSFKIWKKILLPFKSLFKSS